MIFFWIALSGGLLFIFSMMALVRCSLIVATVESGSMAPTLRAGERLLVLRRWPWMRLRRRQIVLVWPTYVRARFRISPMRPYVKRIIGLAGETLTATAVEAPEVSKQAGAGHMDGGEKVWYIPSGHIFVRGDNRKQSLDSVHWGPIPKRCVLGIVLTKLQPRVGSLPPPPPPPPLPSVNSLGLAAGQDAPAFLAQTLNGKRVTDERYRGYPVLFIFFAPSEHCREVVEVCHHLASQGMEMNMVLVSSAPRQPTRFFTKQLGFTLPVLVAPRARNPFLADYKIETTPAYCLVDAQGKVQVSGFLNLRSEQWRQVLQNSGRRYPWS